MLRLLFQPGLMRTGPYECPNCGRSYKHKRGMLQHQKYECGKEARFQCQLCPYKSKLKGNLKSHIIVQHGST